MRFLEIPSFPKSIEFTDLEHAVRTRLSQRTLIWPLQAIPLLGYMAHPNDSDARCSLTIILEEWGNGSTTIPERMRQMQLEWLRLGDVLNLHHDINEGAHQRARGGPSIGKAITLASATSQSWGTSAANLWDIWKRYKDVAHIVAAAVMVTADARERAKKKSFGEFGLPWDQIQPLPVAMMLPDLVLSVGVHLQQYGLNQVPNVTDGFLDSRTLWRIPENINVTALPPPIRKINGQAIRILNARRAGNRGK